MTLNHTKHLFLLISLAIVAGMLAHDGQFSHAVGLKNQPFSSYLSLGDVNEIAARGRHTHSESGSVSAFGDDLIAQFSVGSNV